MQSKEIHVLESFYNNFYQHLPTTPCKQRFKFCNESIIEAPDKLSSDQIIIIKRQLLYSASTQDDIIIRLNKLSCRSFGLYIFSHVFSKNLDNKIVSLTRNDSDILSITIKSPHYNQSKD